MTGTFAEDIHFAAAVGMVFIALQFVGFVLFFSKSGATAIERSSTLAVVAVASTLAADIPLSNREELQLAGVYGLCKNYDEPLVQDAFLRTIKSAASA